ncbi:MAG: stage II sporulation protein P [Lachnospiraceae bacterium]|nr:stage II sporulation protein P [Lachnospiraceae bacterium]
MKKYMYTKKNQLNKSRATVCVMILLVLCMQYPHKEKDIFFELTTQMVPLLTYEQEYGSDDMDYASSYDVPEWFYEDEDALPANGDIVMMEQVADKAVTKPEIEDVTEDKTKGITYTRQELSKPDFLLQKIFVVDANTSMTEEELNLSTLLDTDLSLPDWNGEAYKVLIYHTHASESFVDSRPGHPEDTIVGVGAHLAELLEQKYGVKVYHDTTTYDMIDGKLDRSKAYENSYYGVSKILEEYPSIEVVIDLHRDGVDEETHLVTDIKGKKTAKIMFLNGVSRSEMNGEIAYLENPNKLMNLSFSFQMYLKGKEYYGDFIRKIYVRSLRYNLHVMPRATLIEVGAQNNTLEEEKNAMEPLAAILDKVLSKDK